MARKRIYVDACVLIAACRGTDDAAQVALAALDNENADYLFSRFVELEVLPKPTAFNHTTQVKFFNTFFQSATRLPEPPGLLDDAFDVACKDALSAGDAVHMIWAAAGSADELITLEKSTRLAAAVHAPVPIRSLK